MSSGLRSAQVKLRPHGHVVAQTGQASTELVHLADQFSRPHIGKQ